MDDDAPLLTIGQLSARTGLPVRTIRFWSDTGLVPPAGRSASGRRQYDAHCLARLELVATLRELGLGLAEVREVAEQKATLAEVGTPGDQHRRQLLAQLEAGTDARAERYWQLVGIINGWPPFPVHVPAFEWLIAALRAHS